MRLLRQLSWPMKCSISGDDTNAFGGLSTMNLGAVPRLLAEAATAQQDGNLVRAEALYAEVLRTAPDHPAALNSLGVLKLKAGDSAGAIDLHSRATAADPMAPVLWVNLAKAFRAAENDFEERKALDKALAKKVVLKGNTSEQ